MVLPLNHFRGIFLAIFRCIASLYRRHSCKVYTICSPLSPSWLTKGSVYSPQVRAVKFGHVLVVDEADKAPTHVTCILKSLVESGVMVLGDGRRIVTGK